MKISSFALAFVAVSAFTSSAVFAQSCAAPLPIYSDGTTDPVDTCTANNEIPGFGGLGGGQHNDVVYSFVAQDANATISATSDFESAVYLLDTCDAANGNVLPMQAITNPPGGSFNVGTLTNGQTYYIVVTGSPVQNNPVCGTISVTVQNTLPVELQSFSVD